MRRIYVAGPYSAPTPDGVRKNVELALDIGELIDSLGANAFVPHLFHLWDEHRPAGRERWMAKCLLELERSDALYLIARSPGADREVERARALPIPVFASLRELESWLRLSVPPTAFREPCRSCADTACRLSNGANAGGPCCFYVGETG